MRLVQGCAAEQSWITDLKLHGDLSVPSPAGCLPSHLLGCFQIEQRPRELQCTTSLNLESLPDDLWLPPHVQAGLLTEHETEEFDASLAEGQHCNSPPAQLNTQNSSCGTRRSLRPRKHPSRAALSDEEQVQEPKEQDKRKVGRPLSYTGDPNAKHLTETERRQIKRRIANRDSARRVRQKKLQTVSELSLQLDAAQGREQELHEALALETGRNQTLSDKLHTMQEQMHVLVAMQQVFHAEVHPGLLASAVPYSSSCLNSALEPVTMLDDEGILPASITVPNYQPEPGWQSA